MKIKSYNFINKEAPVNKKLLCIKCVKDAGFKRNEVDMKLIEANFHGISLKLLIVYHN